MIDCNEMIGIDIPVRFCFVCCNKPTEDGIQRTMIGGLILDSFVDGNSWERWQGGAILIPNKIDKPKSDFIRFGQLQQVMLQLGNDEMWKPK